MTPQRAPSRCTKCHRLATNQGRCDQHQVKPWERKSQHTQQVSRHQQRKARARLLATDPSCAVCGHNDPADLELDHITEVADGGDPYDPDNQTLLCKPCHRAKTGLARKIRRYRKQPPRT